MYDVLRFYSFVFASFLINFIFTVICLFSRVYILFFISSFRIQSRKQSQDRTRQVNLIFVRNLIFVFTVPYRLVMQCYNCLQFGHFSSRFPEPQRKARCPSCDKVDGHTSNCANTGFTSYSLFESQTAFEMTNTLKLQFKEVDDVFTVYDVRRQVPIDRTPMWLSAVDAFVGKSEPRTLEFATYRPKKRHVTILDVNENEVISLVFFQKVLTVNDRFHLDDKGVVSSPKGSPAKFERSTMPMCSKYVFGGTVTSSPSISIQ